MRKLKSEKEKIDKNIAKKKRKDDSINKLNNYIYCKECLNLNIEKTDSKWKTVCLSCYKLINKPKKYVDKKLYKKIYLNVLYKDKDIAKELGAKWSNDNRKWYILHDNINKDEILEKWIVCEL